MEDKCEWCKAEDPTVRIRLVKCRDVCRCQDDIPLCDKCAMDPENVDWVEDP